VVIAMFLFFFSTFVLFYLEHVFVPARSGAYVYCLFSVLILLIIYNF
jgi:hypothetical protein